MTRIERARRRALTEASEVFGIPERDLWAIPLAIAFVALVTGLVGALGFFG